MVDQTMPAAVIRFDGLSAQGANEVSFEPDADARTAIAAALEISALKKCRLVGTLRPDGARDWVFEGMLGATVVQPCVVTLEPVTTRIDDPVTRRFVADWEEPEGVEVEMPEDDTSEPLEADVDLARIAIEALSLSLPAFPRRDGAALDETNFAAPGVVPMTDEDARPFAGLASLQDQLKKDDDPQG